MPKIAIFACRTRLWGAIATHRAGLQRETFFSRLSNTYILIWCKENVFCFSSYGIQFLATFLCHGWRPSRERPLIGFNNLMPSGQLKLAISFGPGNFQNMVKPNYATSPCRLIPGSNTWYQSSVLCPTVLYNALYRVNIWTQSDLHVFVVWFITSNKYEDKPSTCRQRQSGADVLYMLLLLSHFAMVFILWPENLW